MTEARHLVTRCLNAWGLGALASAAELTVSELVANGVRHGRGVIEVRLVALPGWARLEIRDHGGGQPAIRPTHQAGRAVGGWGLRMVDQLATSWGTNVTPNHTLV